MTVALSSNTAEAYDLCARGYREWRWSALWDKVEVPQVARRIRRGPGRVIDLGCGYGRYAALCAGAGFEYTGVDASKSMLLAASPQHGSFVNADLFDYDADTPADVVLCTRVLSNVRDAAAALHAVYRNLRPGGAFVLTDFAESYPFSRQTISIGSGDDVAVPVFRHSTRDLKSAIGKAGLTLESESVLHREAGRPVLKMYYGTRAHPKAIRMADRATASWASRPEAAPGS